MKIDDQFLADILRAFGDLQKRNEAANHTRSEELLIRINENVSKLLAVTGRLQES